MDLDRCPVDWSNVTEVRHWELRNDTNIVAIVNCLFSGVYFSRLQANFNELELFSTVS